MAPFFLLTVEIATYLPLFTEIFQKPAAVTLTSAYALES